MVRGSAATAQQLHLLLERLSSVPAAPILPCRSPPRWQPLPPFLPPTLPWLAPWPGGTRLPCHLPPTALYCCHQREQRTGSGAAFAVELTKVFMPEKRGSPGARIEPEERLWMLKVKGGADLSHLRERQRWKTVAGWSVSPTTTQERNFSAVLPYCLWIQLRIQKDEHVLTGSKWSEGFVFEFHQPFL